MGPLSPFLPPQGNLSQGPTFPRGTQFSPHPLVPNQPIDLSQILRALNGISGVPPSTATPPAGSIPVGQVPFTPPESVGGTSEGPPDGGSTVDSSGAVSTDSPGGTSSGSGNGSSFSTGPGEAAGMPTGLSLPSMSQAFSGTLGSMGRGGVAGLPGGIPGILGGALFGGLANAGKNVISSLVNQMGRLDVPDARAFAPAPTGPVAPAPNYTDDPTITALARGLNPEAMDMPTTGLPSGPPGPPSGPVSDPAGVNGVPGTPSDPNSSPDGSGPAGPSGDASGGASGSASGTGPAGSGVGGSDGDGMYLANYALQTQGTPQEAQEIKPKLAIVQRAVSSSPAGRQALQRYQSLAKGVIQRVDALPQHAKVPIQRALKSHLVDYLKGRSMTPDEVGAYWSKAQQTAQQGADQFGISA